MLIFVMRIIQKNSKEINNKKFRFKKIIKINRIRKYIKGIKI